MRASTVVVIASLITASAGAALAQEKKNKGLQVKSLPAAVQKTVQENLKGGEIRNIGREKEDGVEQFEIETVLNGKSRDFNVDTKGTLLVMEEATTLDAIPESARASILKKTAGGTVTRVEAVSRPGQPTTYEAAYTDAKGKKHSVTVRAAM
jgi:predicted aspartyl protease